MLAWQMNLGFAASETGQLAPPAGGNLPYGMSVSDGLWLACLVLSLLLHF